MALIKKKDNKLDEIRSILVSEVTPKLEQLKKDREDYQIFKSNENQIEEFEKLLAAFEYHDNLKVIQGEARIKIDFEKRESEIRNKISIISDEIY